MFAVIYLTHFSTDCRQFLRDYFIVCGHTVAKQPIYECENFLLHVILLHHKNMKVLMSFSCH